MIQFTWIALGILALFALGFRFYGRYIQSVFQLSDSKPTPAELINDGVDYVPTRPAILLGQHFSAIAAVGPIAGPILAGLQFGWLAGLLWIVFGAIFIGAVHDFATLIASVRHGARSIGDLLKDYLGSHTSLVFSIFIWFSLLYVIVVFTDLTASAFVSRPELGLENFGPGVATSSFLYLGLSLLLGLALSKFKMPLSVATLIFVPMIFVVIWLGQKIPIVFSGDGLHQQQTWDLIILVYCFFASIIPMWILLQPRGYLGGFILYSTFVVGLVGIFFSGAPIQYPAKKLVDGAGFCSSWSLFFPLMFTTIACGSCSGFHGLVSSGTTSKQIRKETDCRIVGYGGMLLESLVAVIALATLMMLSQDSPELKLGPDEIYARGLAHFMGVFGIPFGAGVTFGKLAFATFIYDTLDVSTRLGRYVLEEITHVKGKWGAYAATLITLIVPLIMIYTPMRDALGNPVPLWKVFWPAFGASNQLLAALSLLGITVWLRKEKKNWLVTGIPAIFMTVVSLSSLVVILKSRLLDSAHTDPVGITAVILLGLGLYYIYHVIREFLKS